MIFPKIQTHTLVGIGEVTEPIKTAFEQGKFPNVKNYIDLEYANPETIIEKIYPLLQDRILFGVGNIHGQGEEFIEKLLSMSTDDNSLPRQNQTLVEENKETKNVIINLNFMKELYKNNNTFFSKSRMCCYF